MAVVSGWSGEVAKAVKDINQGGAVRAFKLRQQMAAT